jgi:hypothetical protein
LLETSLGLGLLLLFGIFTGTLAGLLGIGGGLLLVPALIFAGAETTVQATATSLIGVFLSATSGSIRNLQAGELNWKASLTLAAFGMMTAQVGAWLGSRLSDALLSLGFAALLLLAIYLMGLKKKLVIRKERQKREAIAHMSPGETHYGANEDADGETPPHATYNYKFLPMACIGLAAGILAGLFGVGGGVVMVPLQMLILGEDIKAAVRTSLGAIVAIAASGLVQHTLNNNVLWVPGLVLGVGGIMGAQFGTRLLPKLPERTIAIMFRILLIALAVYMLIRAATA